MNTSRFLASLLIAVWGCQIGAAETISASDREFFESRIRPVLIEHCYECHNSADAAEGGLVIDHRDAMLRGGDSGAVVIAGKPDQSRLIKVLRHEIDGLEMPDGGPKLEESIVRDFEKWILLGLPDPRDEAPSQQDIQSATSWEQTIRRRKQWWSFQPIRDVQSPQTLGSDNPIDGFIRQGLDSAGLSASPPADSATLIRRLYFGLTGLPPTAEQATHWAQRFEDAKDRGQEIERLVSQLLGSQQYGERWARHWMDWIRYAESHGSEGDPRIENAWMYRDYLIRALNQDVPYDQLVTEHIAGDLMANPRIDVDRGINESKIGTAHWRMVFHGFAPTDALDEKVRFIDDQINVFSKAFMGLTVSCARCHDHKFDAISQADYYALFGILGSCRPGRNVVDTPPRQNVHRDELTKLKTRIRKAIAEHWLSEVDLTVTKLLAAGGGQPNLEGLAGVFAELRHKIDNGESFRTAWDAVAGVQTNRLAASDRFMAEATALKWNFDDDASRKGWNSYGVGLHGDTSAGQFAIALIGDSIVRGIYPSGVYSHLVSSKHPGRLSSADFKIGKDLAIWAQVVGGDDASLRYVVHDYPRNGTVYPVIKLQERFGWRRFDLSYWGGESIHVELATAMDAPLLTSSKPRSWFGVRTVMVTGKDVKEPPGGSTEALADILQAARENPPQNQSELAAILATTLVKAINAWSAGTASDSQALLLDACLQSQTLTHSLEQLPSVAPWVRQYRELEEQIPVPTRVPGLEETPGEDQRLMVRGDHKSLGRSVPRRFLEAIDDTAYRTLDSGRLELANDLVRVDNPLTKRVIVNRVWHHLFGSGIVSTPDNFGRLGSLPSNPQLLDWLAVRFERDGWSLKKLIRLIVTSQTWQRSSSPMPGVADSDPDNRFFARANIRRLEAEAIRDSLLSVSGRLDDRLYGDSVGISSPRRSVYVKVIRNALDPFLRAFDFPEPFSTVGRRSATNVPAQSLAMMNDAQIAGFASDWARRFLNDEKLTEDPERVNQMFLDAFGREASEEEVSRSLDYLEQTGQEVWQRILARKRLNEQRNQLQTGIDFVLNAARASIGNPSGQDQERTQIEVPSPINEWDFTDGLEDRIGESNAKPLGGARRTSRGLIVHSGGYALTAPITKRVTEKTMEVWVKLDTLDQRGGGVMTIQSTNGRLFDSIVFAEKASGEWLAGSNHFARTESFAGKKEDEATRAPVHLAIVYHADGSVSGYRNGKKYGRTFESDGPQPFERNESVVSFGLRHLPVGGNRMLAGSILRARLYDVALTADQIAASAAESAPFVSEERLFERLTSDQRQKISDDRKEVNVLKRRLQTIPDSDLDETQQTWADFARALFSFKEFIYVR